MRMWQFLRVNRAWSPIKILHSNALEPIQLIRYIRITFAIISGHRCLLELFWYECCNRGHYAIQNACDFTTIPGGWKKCNNYFAVEIDTREVEISSGVRNSIIDGNEIKRFSGKMFCSLQHSYLSSLSFAPSSKNY